MYGLDSTLVATMDYGLSIGRVKTDVLNDFLLAPHYSVIYTYAADELIERVKTLLSSGQYISGLPVKVDVPKRSGLTRPGAILRPLDRLVYQMLVDNLSGQAESQLDRSRVFSHVLLTDDPEFRMFRRGDECWQNMQNALQRRCQDSNLHYVVKTDIACFFERIYQHNLINLLHASGCDSRVVNLLEKVLLAFTERDSHGILQGLFPSDFLGNFYLASLDNHLEVRNTPSVRYVDDLYLFYPSLLEAKKGLVNLCSILRDEGLNLNESKTKIAETSELLAEETEINRLFGQAKDEIRECALAEALSETAYGFQTIWGVEEEGLPEKETELQAMKELYQQVTDSFVDAEKIEKFCLPYLAQAGSGIGVERSLEGIIERPHLSKMYCSYLRLFARGNIDISRQLESVVVSATLPYEWSLIWPIAVLIDVESVARDTITKAIQILEDARRLPGLRGVAAHLAAKHGSAGQRRLLRHQYDQEPSPYVKESLLFSAKYFPTNERNSCLGAWGSQSATNSLIASAIRAGTP